MVTKKRDPKGLQERQRPAGGHRREDREEFSDGGLSEEEQGEDRPEDHVIISKNRPNTSFMPDSRKHLDKRLNKTKREDGSNQSTSDVTADILRPKKLEEPTPSKTRKEENICTSTFLCQLIIILACVAALNYFQVSFLNKSVHVSDRTSIHIEDKIDETIDIKVPKAVDRHLQQLIRNEVEAAVGDQKSRIVNEVENKLYPKIEDARRQFEGFTDNMFEEKRKVEEVTKRYTNLNDNLQDVKEKQGLAETSISYLFANLSVTSFNISELSENYSRLFTTTTSGSADIIRLQETVKGQKDELDSAISSISEELVDLKNKLTQARELYEQYEDKVGQLNDINRKLEEIQPNMFNKEKFTMAFMILLVIVLGLAVAVFCLYQRQHDVTDRRTNYRVDNGPLEQTSKARWLEPGVCIISFDESRTSEHRRILDSANIPNCKVEVCVIRRHEHIHKLPKCKVYLMCTEFSERHVIIEEQGKGLGDLHRTAYYAVKAIGGCLIILYTKDPLSKKLSEDTLYNTNIYCVTHQPELSVLNDDDRFFSVYNDLTPHQKTVLRNKIIENMK